MSREVRVFSSQEEAEKADLEERRRMTPEERLRLGAELHEFWVRNYHPDAPRRLERIVRVVRRP